MASRKIEMMSKSETVKSEKAEVKSDKYEESDVEASQIEIDERQKAAAATKKPKKRVKLNRFNREKKADRHYDCLFRAEQTGLFRDQNSNVTNNVNISINITNTNFSKNQNENETSANDA